VFNVWKGPFRPSLGPEARRLLERMGPGGGAKIRAGEWKRGFDSLPFTPLQERHLDHEDVADRDRVVAHLVSTSSAGELGESERRVLGAELRAAIPVGGYRVEIDTQLYEAARL
jgi:hypothetical protein